MAEPEKQGKGTPVKQKRVGNLADKLRASHLAVITDYRGMKMAEISDLRGQLRKANSEFHIVKNTLARLAGTATGTDLASALTGTSAIAFCFGDDVTGPAKLLADFARVSKFLKIRAALLQGQLVGGEQLMAIANLPPRAVLQAQLLGALQGPQANAVSVFGSPMQGLLAVLQARAQQLG